MQFSKNRRTTNSQSTNLDKLSMPSPDRANRFLKYSGLAFQILAYLLIGYFIGHFIDKKMNTEQPYYTAAGTIVFLFIAIYSIIRDILRNK